MKIHIDRQTLADGLGLVQKTVAARTASPILECILLAAQGDSLVLTANNLEMGIETKPLPAQVQQEGLLALSARLFSEIIRKVQGDVVTIESDGKQVTKIACGASEFKILGMDGAAFPALPEVPREDPFTIDQGVMKNMIRQTIFSIAQDELRPVLTGELLEAGEEKLKLVSVDGYRISYRQARMKGCLERVSAIIPGKSMSELGRLLEAESEEEVKVYFTERHILFDLPQCLLVSRLIEGDYIQYQQSFGAEYPTVAQARREALVQAIERASILSTDLRKSPVKLSLMEGVLTITSHSELGDTREELPVVQEGPDLTIAFNPRYLLEALKAIDEEEVKLQMSTALSPLVIVGPEGGEDYLYLILPLRM